MFYLDKEIIICHLKKFENAIFKCFKHTTPLPKRKNNYCPYFFRTSIYFLLSLKEIEFVFLTKMLLMVSRSLHKEFFGYLIHHPKQFLLQTNEVL